jgi:hypothetical protein
MRRTSIVAPLLFIGLGVLFLFRNLHPELPVIPYLARYWPFLLIGWGVLRLAEVLFWAATSKPLPARGISPGEWVLVLFICIFGAGLHASLGFSSWWPRTGLATGGLDVFGERFEYPIAVEKSCSRTPRVVLEDFRGNAHIMGGDVDKVTVTGRESIRSLTEERANRAHQDSPLELAGDANRIVVRTNQTRFPGPRPEEDLEIMVPKGAAIETRGRGGDFDLENLDGPVTMEGVYTGVLEFRNLGGQLHIKGVQTEVQIEKLPGEMRMALGNFNGTNLGGPVHLSARSRDVQISGFTNALELSIERGDIDLRPGGLPLARMDIHTHSGDVTLSLPPAAKFDLTASTRSGEITNDFGAPLNVEHSRRGATLRGSTGGGPVVTLETDRGKVTILKASEESTLHKIEQ